MIIDRVPGHCDCIVPIDQFMSDSDGDIFEDVVELDPKLHTNMYQFIMSHALHNFILAPVGRMKPIVLPVRIINLDRTLSS